MGFTAKQLLEAAELLGALNGDEGSDKAAEDKAAEAKKAEEAAAAKKAEEAAAAEKAAAAKKAEEEKASKKDDDAKKDEPAKKEGEEEPDVLRELREKVANANLERTKTKIASAFVSKGIVEEEARSVLDFLDYGKIISSEGEVDEDKISTLVDSISSLSLRKPPRGETKDFSSNAGGIGKYLTKK